MGGMATRSERPPLAVRVLGFVGAVMFMLAGLVLLLLGIFAQFDTRSNVHPIFRPDALYSSFDGVAELDHPSRDYAITSLNSPLETCTVSSRSGPLELMPDQDPYFTDRSVFRFTAPPGSYDIVCEPDVWFEVYPGADVEVAVRGYVGAVHPTVYYLGASVVCFVIGNVLWKRFVQRPRVW